MKKNRKNFLLNYWIPYPSADIDLQYSLNFCGRIVGVDQTHHQIILQKHHQIYHIFYLDLYWEKGGDNAPSPETVLDVGDWVQILSPLEKINEASIRYVKLLSPHIKGSLMGEDGSKNLLNETDFLLYREWIQFKNRLKSFFIEKGFDEIDSPTLVPCPGTEPFLEPFETYIKMGSSVQKCYLPTSPELSLKKCLARGWENIFEIRPCFRNGEESNLHRPEFYMLEWYRSFRTLDSIREDIFGLLDYIKFPSWQRDRCSSLSVAEVFKSECQIILKPETTSHDLWTWIKTNCKSHQLTDGMDQWDFDDLFNFIYIEKVEPQLHKYPFLILEKYPPSQAALARLTHDGWGDRFEFYINGIEIANAFHELNDPKIQSIRFREDLEKKRKHGKTMIDLDFQFMEALEKGMPPSSGIALGVDRLFMTFKGLHNINQIKS